MSLKSGREKRSEPGKKSSQARSGATCTSMAAATPAPPPRRPKSDAAPPRGGSRPAEPPPPPNGPAAAATRPRLCPLHTPGKAGGRGVALLLSAAAVCSLFLQRKTMFTWYPLRNGESGSDGGGGPRSGRPRQGGTGGVEPWRGDPASGATVPQTLALRGRPALAAMVVRSPAVPVRVGQRKALPALPHGSCAACPCAAMPGSEAQPKMEASG